MASTAPTQPFYTLHSQSASLVVDCRDKVPSILYWGPRLHADTTPEMLALLTTRPQAQVSPEREAPVALSPELGAGFAGNAGIQGHREGRAWALYAQIKEVDCGEPGRLSILSECEASALRIVHELGLDEASGVLSATTEIVNLGEGLVWVDQCNAPCIPVPPHYDRILGFEGRWANEFQLRRVERFLGSYVRENRAGRTSHDSFPGVIIHTAQTNESAGGAFGLHLGWSGNHCIRVQQEMSGRAYAQLGELFYPGELSLAPGESYRSPPLYGARSHDGLSGISRSFHRFVRDNLTDARMRGKTKPVHFNTWEAVYFDLSTDRLCELAREAADIGVERFVLDDGWFRGRVSDRAGLGDWYVDETRFPEGLHPLVRQVQALGMEFGLWVEPEMVNPDSDLYRAHPDWALHADPAPRLLSRHQLALDLTREEVQDYLYGRIDSLLREYPIAYLKWDMNRNLEQPGDADGRAVAHCQTRALYGLLERVRKAHPEVEIESCSSGGARADFGILDYTDRIWTSDTNDAMDRLRVQRGFSFFFPAEFMGAHVGPYQCHITGRRLTMATRAGVALFGDMGIETDLLALDAAEKEELRAAVALHKKHRRLLLGGELVRLDMPDYECGFGVISPDRREAMFFYALLDTHPNSAAGRFRFQRLDEEASYRLDIVWPLRPETHSTSALEAVAGQVFSGDALMRAGMQLPMLQPHSVLIMRLCASA